MLDNNGKFAKESAIYDLINTDTQKQLLAFGCAYDVPNIKSDNRKVIYLGLAHQHWGHFLVDVVQRLWFIVANESSLKTGELKDYWFAFSGFGNEITEFKGNYLEFFKLFGLNIGRIIIVEEATRFKQVVVPDIAVYPGQYIHTVFRQVFNKVVASAMQVAESKSFPRYDRIYFSRTHLKDVKEMGEAYIQLALERCGYKSLFPEELDLVEQIWYWQTAKEIACINGSITHNSVFAKPQLKLYVFNKMSRVVGYQMTMDAVWGNTPIYVSAYKEPVKNYPISVSRGPFWIAITEDVKMFLKEIYNEKVDIKNNVGDLSRYRWLCFVARAKYAFRGGKTKIKSIWRRINN